MSVHFLFVCRSRHVAYVAELQTVLQRAWDTISIETINKLSSGFARRLSLCLESKGQSISRLLGSCGAEQAVYRWRPDNQVQGEWTTQEEALVYQWVRERGVGWNDLEKLLPGRTANAIKNRWYAVLQKTEQALMRDTETIFDIRDRMRRGMPIPEVCKEVSLCPVSMIPPPQRWKSGVISLRRSF
jgi:hypothetical protein